MYYFLDKRTKKILKELIKSEAFITAGYLGKLIGASDRTIRNCIKIINNYIGETGLAVTSLMGKGYQIEVIDEEKYNHLLRYILKEDQKEDLIIPTFPEDRIKYIIRKLLYSHDYITLEEVANELYVSKTTVDKDLYKAEKILKKFDLTVKRKRNYGVILEGNELNIRLCMSHYLNSEVRINDNKILPKSFNTDIFSNINLNDIEKILIKNIKNVDIRLTDITLYNLIVHIAIAIKRIKSGYKVKENHFEDIDNITKTKEYEVAKNISNEIETIFKIPIPKEETLYIAVHLLSKKVIIDSHINYDYLKQVLGEYVLTIIKEILVTIRDTFYIDLSNDEDFILGLALHLKPALNRMKYNMHLKNPLLEEIKSDYSYPFEMAVTASNVISKYTGFIADEDEIGYIALHFAAALERQNFVTKEKIKNILIVCTTGIGTAKLLEVKVKRIFNNMKTIKTLPLYKLNDVNLKDVDLVITTVPVNIKYNIPVIQVSSLLGEDDIDKINKLIYRKAKKNIILSRQINKLNQLFDNELFLKNLICNNYHEVIKKITDVLKDKGYVDNTFETSVLFREKVASTAYDNLVALPHAINEKSEVFKIAVAILKNPINWINKRVQLVLLLILPKNKIQDYEEVFEELLSIVNNQNQVRQLIKSKNYEDFIKTINSTDRLGG